jgi:SSS family transporter
LGTADLFIVMLYLATVVAAGSWFSRRQKTTRHYFTGGGAVPWWAVAASIVATETSTVTFISVPGVAYARNGNFTFLQLALGYILGRVLISWLFMPRYFQGEILTVYQLLAERFGSGVKALLASLFVAMRTAGDGIRLLLTAGVLASVWNAFSPGTDSANAMIGASVGLGLVMILFTLWGGMEAVIWIEVVQLAVYLFGAAVAAWVLADNIEEGARAALDTASKYHKFDFFNFTATLDKSAGTTIWAGLFGGAALNMSTHGTDQYLVQRYLCVRSPRQASAALLVSGFVVFAQFALFLTIGILLFSYYRPFEAADYATTANSAAPFLRNDDVFTNFIVYKLPPGAGGLVVAAILAAALSSSLNSIAAAVVNDLVRPVMPGRSDGFYLKLSKGITCAAGVAQIGVAIALRGARTSALDQVLAIAGLLNGPVLGIFLLGAISKRAGRTSALAGLAGGAGAALCAWQFTDIYWAWYTAIGAAATVSSGLLVSILFDHQKTVESKKLASNF